MRLPAALCKMQRKKRETDGFSKNILMTPPGSHPTSGFGARHGLPKFFGHKKRRIVQNDARASPVDIPTGWDPRTKQQRRVALADFSAAPWQGFEKSERGPNNSSLFQPQAAVVVVALWLCLRHKCRRLVRDPLPRTKRKTRTQCVLVFGAREGTRTPKDKPHAPQTCASASSATLAYRIVFAALKSLR